MTPPILPRFLPLPTAAPKIEYVKAVFRTETRYQKMAPDPRVLMSKERIARITGCWKNGDKTECITVDAIKPYAHSWSLISDTVKCSFQAGQKFVLTGIPLVARRPDFGEDKTNPPEVPFVERTCGPHDYYVMAGIVATKGVPITEHLLFMIGDHEEMKKDVNFMINNKRRGWELWKLSSTYLSLTQGVP